MIPKSEMFDLLANISVGGIRAWGWWGDHAQETGIPARDCSSRSQKFRAPG
jgi:hypothetical protein